MSYATSNDIAVIQGYCTSAGHGPYDDVEVEHLGDRTYRAFNPQTALRVVFNVDKHTRTLVLDAADADNNVDLAALRIYAASHAFKRWNLAEVVTTMGSTTELVGPIGARLQMRVNIEHVNTAEHIPPVVTVRLEMGEHSSRRVSLPFYATGEHHALDRQLLESTIHRAVVHILEGTTP